MKDTKFKINQIVYFIYEYSAVKARIVEIALISPERTNSELCYKTNIGGYVAESELFESEKALREGLIIQDRTKN